MAPLGVLALQGSFGAHARALRRLGRETVEVRRTGQLAGVAGLVIPGGESTTLLNLMGDEPWFEALREFHRDGGVLFGTCAGAILLAREVLDPPQPSLQLIDIVVRRNAFGRQVDSFESDVELVGTGAVLHAAFIRAPRFERPGPGVEVLARLGDEPVLVREGRVIAATFHTELTDDPRLHRVFLATVEQSQATTSKVPRRPVPGTAPSGLVA